MSGLSNRRFLVVEDEALIGLHVESILAVEGCDVAGPVRSVADALTLINEDRLDGAILDINLGTEMVFPVADALERASIPFVFVTGYDHYPIPVQHRQRPKVTKPYVDHTLVTVLRGLFAQSGAVA